MIKSKLRNKLNRETLDMLMRGKLLWPKTLPDKITSKEHVDEFHTNFIVDLALEEFNKLETRLLSSDIVGSAREAAQAELALFDVPDSAADSDSPESNAAAGGVDLAM